MRVSSRSVYLLTFNGADAQLWDHRKEDCIRSYPHHFDYISDFTYFDDKRQLVSTSYVPSMLNGGS